MRFGLVSAKFVNNDVPGNIDEIEHWLNKYTIAGPDFLCFGEAFLNGYLTKPINSYN